MNNKSYDEKGIEIYKKKGILSFNELDKQFKRYNDTNNNKTFNHIHIAMSFNDDYSLLSSVTIASLLKNADKNTYIHLHIIAVDNFGYSWMKKLNSLKYKINNNTEFIFHNGDRVEKDFGTDIKNDSKGMPEFSRLLAPYCANDTDRIIVTDSADLLIEKDLLELYNYPLEDKLVKGVIDPYTNCFPDYQTFHKENYFNGGVLLFNSKRWREMNLYQDIVNFYNGFKFKGTLPTPIQDILNTFFPAISLGLLPFEFNFQGYFNLDDDGNEDSLIYSYYCSKFFEKKKELIEYEKKLFIRHCNKNKVETNEAHISIQKRWIYYANMTGFFKELCEKYPFACEIFIEE
jgi:lipopolysaccharide biosynthesis glycosyltransferase